MYGIDFLFSIEWVIDFCFFLFAVIILTQRRSVLWFPKFSKLTGSCLLLWDESSYSARLHCSFYSVIFIIDLIR